MHRELIRSRSAMTQTTLAGGCLCGAVRYVGHGPLEAGYCHCRMCQRSSGAPAQTWVSFEVERFRYEKGSPSVYRSSSVASREFCPVCGSQLAFRDDRSPGTVAVNTGTLDDPASVSPELHIWTSSRVPWFDTKDDLPRHEGEAPLPSP
jgi:hypothetical protein